MGEAHIKLSGDYYPWKPSSGRAPYGVVAKANLHVRRAKSNTAAVGTNIGASVYCAISFAYVSAMEVLEKGGTGQGLLTLHRALVLMLGNTFHIETQGLLRGINEIHGNQLKM